MSDTAPNDGQPPARFPNFAGKHDHDAALHEDGWKPEGIGAAETRARLEALLEASIAALR